jgi:glucose-6-phosphate 1-dehydrogenase
VQQPNPALQRATNEEINMAVVADAQTTSRTKDQDSSGAADVFVAFGITGDLAKVMTFRSLYRLERRGLLNCPILGVSVDDWSVDQLREHARSAITGTGEALDDKVFDRFAARLSYVQGDFGDAATYARVRAAIGSAQRPVFYLEIPPFLFGTVVKGLSEAGLTKNARVVVEKPFGHDLASARALAADIHQYIDESQLYRIDHYLGKMGLDELLYLRFANTMFEPVWNRHHISSVQITMAEAFGVEDRGHFYDRVGALQDVVVNHLMQLVAMVAMEAPAGADADTLKDARFAVFRSMATADPRHYVRGQYDGYLGIDGVAEGSTTETYAALRLQIDNWRWAGVPFFIRTGKRLPLTQTELRLVFHRPPPLRFISSTTRAPADGQLVVKLDPTTGVRLEINAHRADQGGPKAVTLDMEFAQEGGEGATPYEVLLQAAMDGDSSKFTRQDGVEEAWRIMAPLVDTPPPVHPYAPGSMGPKEADRLVAGSGRWHAPWVAS